MNWAGLSIAIGLASLALTISPWLFAAVVSAFVAYLFAKS